MRESINRRFWSLAIIIAMIAAPAWVQAELLDLKVDMGDTGQPVPAGNYRMTTYHHDAQYGGDGRIMPTVTLNDALGGTVVDTDVYVTLGYAAPFSYRLLPQNGSIVYYQAMLCR